MTQRRKDSREREENKVVIEVGVEFMHDIPETILALLNHIVEIEKGIPSVVRAAEPNI